MAYKHIAIKPELDEEINRMVAFFQLMQGRRMSKSKVVTEAVLFYFTYMGFDSEIKGATKYADNVTQKEVFRLQAFYSEIAKLQASGNLHLLDKPHNWKKLLEKVGF